MRLLLVSLVTLLLVSPAQALATSGRGTWTVGPNLGFRVVSPSGGGNSLFAIGWPSGSELVFGGVQPGFRLGYVTPGGGSDVFLDTGLSYVSSSGSSFYSVLNTLNFQLNFAQAAETTPYATAGGGVAILGFDGTSETHALVGLGVGIRRSVSDGHGAVRSEFRYDHLSGASGGDGANSFGVKIGVDLWIP